MDAAGKKGDREREMGMGSIREVVRTFLLSRCCHLVHLFEHMVNVNYLPELLIDGVSNEDGILLGLDDSFRICGVVTIDVNFCALWRLRVTLSEQVRHCSREVHS